MKKGMLNSVSRSAHNKVEQLEKKVPCFLNVYLYCSAS